jgi:hypothetical protein
VGGQFSACDVRHGQYGGVVGRSACGERGGHRQWYKQQLCSPESAPGRRTKLPSSPVHALGQVSSTLFKRQTCARKIMSLVSARKIQSRGITGLDVKNRE